MLAIASLATGFVVAAVSPSHAADHEPLGDLHVKDTLSTLDYTLGQDTPTADAAAPGQSGQNG